MPETWLRFNALATDAHKMEIGNDYQQPTVSGQSLLKFEEDVMVQCGDVGDAKIFKFVAGKPVEKVKITIHIGFLAERDRIRKLNQAIEQKLASA